MSYTDRVNQNTGFHAIRLSFSLSPYIIIYPHMLLSFTYITVFVLRVLLTGYTRGYKDMRTLSGSSS